MSEIIIGIVGDGQLAKMMIQAGQAENQKFVVLPLSNTSTNKSPSICHGIAEIASSYQELAQKSDVITYETESANVEELQQLEDQGLSVIPSSNVLRVIKNKWTQKEFYQRMNIPTTTGYTFTNVDEFKKIISQTDSKGGLVIKKAYGGYNGLGILKYYCNSPYSEKDLNEFVENGKLHIVEKMVDIKKELAIIVARDQNENFTSYEPVEVKLINELLEYLISPIPDKDEQHICDMKSIAKKIVEGLDGIGVFAIEFFLTADNQLLVNETSPRVHNSGHHTIETSNCSQFKQLNRILLGKSLITTNDDQIEKVIPSLMVNILGSDKIINQEYQYNQNVIQEIEDLYKKHQVYFHFYGKEKTYPDRKLGHLTIKCQNDPDTTEKLLMLVNKLVLPKKTKNKSHHNLSGFDDIRYGHQEITSLSNLPKRLTSHPRTLPNQNSSIPNIQIGIIMGSISDAKVMQGTFDILDHFSIPYEKRVVSAHRTPYDMIAYGTYAESRGLKIIIAGAGGAAHLPGMIASVTNLPVIGVPVKSSNLSGLDSLYSIVQMPRGVPVATVAINGSINAGLLAMKILAINDLVLRQELEKYRQEIANESYMSNQDL